MFKNFFNALEKNLKIDVNSFLILKNFVVSRIVSDSPLKYIVKKYGNTIISTYYPAGSAQINSFIRPVPIERVEVIVNLLQDSAQKHHLELAYLTACIYQEGRFSEQAINHNLKDSNPIPTFATTDFGIAQFSGRYLPNRSGMQGLTQPQMQAKAMTAEWSIPIFAEVMAALLNNAAQVLATDSELIAKMHQMNNTRLSDVFFLATAVYNKGLQGAISLIKSGSSPKHPFSVANWYAQFSILR